ncbi:MAG TPA: FmdB family zinc ribbon protein [Actinomycetota bacterium]|nr:FmdB family zinc ribbon protein [Actinomycetota bacterium]
MPVYEYACTTCGERTEARQTFDDPPLEECPICGGPLRKLYSPVGIVFKGSGFYSTESKRDSRSRDGHAAASSNSDKADKRKESKGSEAGSGSGDSSAAAAGSTTGSGSGSGSSSGSGGTSTSDKSG